MEEKNTTMGTTETMEDYKEALEASYRRIRPGDIVSGTVSLSQRRIPVALP